jgi:biotin transporter BioY
MYVGGLSQLSIITGSLTAAAVIGVLPFVAADLIKAIVAAALSGRRSGTTS